jgi:hypothetical protein
VLSNETASATHNAPITSGQFDKLTEALFQNLKKKTHTNKQEKNTPNYN